MVLVQEYLQLVQESAGKKDPVPLFLNKFKILLDFVDLFAQALFGQIFCADKI